MGALWHAAPVVTVPRHSESVTTRVALGYPGIEFERLSSVLHQTAMVMLLREILDTVPDWGIQHSAAVVGVKSAGVDDGFGV